MWNSFLDHHIPPLPALKTEKLAELLSLVLSPSTLGALAAAALVASETAEATLAPLIGFGMGLVFLGILPAAPVAAGDGVNGLSGTRMTDKSRRVALLLWAAPVYAAGALAFRLIGWTSLSFLSVSYSLAALALAVTSTRVRVSLHAAGLAVPGVTLALLRGVWWLFSLALVIPVAWARIKLGVHTLAHVLLGAVIGGLIPLLIWFL